MLWAECAEGQSRTGNGRKKGGGGRGSLNIPAIRYSAALEGVTTTGMSALKRSLGMFHSPRLLNWVNERDGEGGGDWLLGDYGILIGNFWALGLFLMDIVHCGCLKSGVLNWMYKVLKKKNQ